MMKTRYPTPKDTFTNLPLDKRLKIEAALVKEFAANGYQKASLNTVVKELGIAKGSLYQYFANKEMIFLYIFDQFTRRVKDMVQQPPAGESGLDLWAAVRRTILAGIAFIDRFPDSYQLYLTVLFAHDVPHREELIAKVRLFSMEYFGPLIAQGQERGEVPATIPVAMVVFVIDAVLDRFLQGYARTYLDGGLGLAAKDGMAITAEVELLIDTLRHGLAVRG
jgi:AcrR family transcriptional regulator